MTWREAKVIRSEYPRRLTNAHIREIFERWGDIGDISKNDSYMFQFACTLRTDGKMNMSELKMWFMFDNLVHEHEIKMYNDKKYNHPTLQKSHGMIISAWFNHIIDGGEYEPHTQNLRKRLLRQLLRTWKKVSSCFSAQVVGVQTIIEIKTNVRADMIKRYPHAKKHFSSDSFENECWTIIDNFINEKRRLS